MKLMQMTTKTKNTLDDNPFGRLGHRTLNDIKDRRDSSDDREVYKDDDEEDERSLPKAEMMTTTTMGTNPMNI